MQQDDAPATQTQPDHTDQWLWLAGAVLAVIGIIMLVAAASKRKAARFLFGRSELEALQSAATLTAVGWVTIAFGGLAAIAGAVVHGLRTR